VCDVEIDASHPLPPPKNAARELQKQAAKALKNWYENFGQTYKKLSLGYNYLLTSKKVIMILQIIFCCQRCACKFSFINFSHGFYALLCTLSHTQGCVVAADLLTEPKVL
jgi:hypothetical protein